MRSYHTAAHRQLRMLTSIAARVRFAVYKPIKPVVCCSCTTRSIVAILSFATSDMATSSTIIGSASMELEQAFRMMALELGEKLRLDECQKIAYVSSRMDGPAPPDCDYRLHVFSTLEARGLIGPLKLDFLEEVLERIGRKDLLSIIAKYKKKPIYKEVHSKRKLKGRTKRKKDQTMQSATTTDSTQFKDIYTCFLTQFAEIALRMRSALESDDTACMKYTFSSIANDGDAVARMLKKKLSIHAGINRDSSSTMSSGESSGMITGSTENNHPRMHLIVSNCCAHVHIQLILAQLHFTVS